MEQTRGRFALCPRWIVPVVPEGELVENHAVVVEDGRISEIPPLADLDSDWVGIERIDLPGRALIPGLINCHTHSAMTLLRGLADDLPLMVWLGEHIWPAEQRWVGPDYVRDGTELALAEMLTGGTTCFNDNYFFPDVTAACAVRAGMRAVIGLPIINMSTAWADSESACFERGLSVHQDLMSEPLVSTAFAPHAPYTVSDAGFERIATLAEEMDVPVHLHLLEAAGEVENSIEQTGLHPLDRLDRLGLLGPRLLAVHMTQLDDQDMDRVARHGVHVLHCPASNLKLASGLCPVEALDRRGVNIAIGTDGAASNNTLDMFAEMRLAALLAKGVSGDPETIPAPRALSMATIQAARALGLEEAIGSIEPGKQADLAAVDLDWQSTGPVHNVISQLVYATDRRQVTDVWVAGKRLVADRELLALNRDQLKEQARRWQQKLKPS